MLAQPDIEEGSIPPLATLEEHGEVDQRTMRSNSLSSSEDIGRTQTTSSQATDQITCLEELEVELSTDEHLRGMVEDFGEGSMFSNIDLAASTLLTEALEEAVEAREEEESNQVFDGLDLGAEEDVDEPSFQEHIEELNRSICYRYRYDDAFREHEYSLWMALQSAPEYPEHYHGVTLRDGVVEVLPVEEGFYEALLSVNHVHSMDFGGLSQLLSSMKMGEDRINQFVGVVSILVILFKNISCIVTVTACCAALASLLGVAEKFGNAVKSLVSRAYALLTQKSGIAQGRQEIDDGEESRVAHFLGLCSEFEVLKALSYLGGIFFLVGVGWLLKVVPSSSHIDAAMRRIKNLPGTVKSAGEIGEFGAKLTKNVLNAIRKHVFGIDVEEFDALKEVNQWMDAVSAMAAMDVSHRIRSDAATQARADALYTQGLNIGKVFDTLRIPSNQQVAFRNHLLLAARLRDEAHSSGAGFQAPRHEPLVALFYGASGLGKSLLIHAITIDLMRRRGVTDFKNINNFVYYRKVAQEYWDGFTSNHKIVVVDDFGAVKDNELKPNEEFYELICSGNIAPYPVHMADLGAKANTFFHAEAVLLTSNQGLPNINSLNYPEAVFRRFDLRIQVRVKPIYGKEVIQEGERVFVLDPSKVTVTADSFLKPYLFDIVDPSDRNRPSTNFSHTDLSYEEMMKILLERDRCKSQHSVDIVDVLKIYAERQEQGEHEMDAPGVSGDAPRQTVRPTAHVQDDTSNDPEAAELLQRLRARRLEVHENSAQTRAIRKLKNQQAELLRDESEDPIWKVLWHFLLARLGFHVVRGGRAHFDMREWLGLPVAINMAANIQGFTVEERNAAMALYGVNCFTVPVLHYERVIMAMRAALAWAESCPDNPLESFTNMYLMLAPEDQGVVVFPEPCPGNCENETVRRLRELRAVGSGVLDYSRLTAQRLWQNEYRVRFTNGLYEWAQGFFDQLYHLTQIFVSVWLMFGLFTLVFSWATSKLFGRKNEPVKRVRHVRKKISVEEANISGDDCEQEVSGTSLTKTAVRRGRIESQQEVSGGSTTKAQPRRGRLEMDIEEGDHEVLLDENSTKVIESLFLHNVYKLEVPIEYDDDGHIVRWKQALNVTFIRGRVALVNRHFELLRGETDYVRLRGVCAPDGILLEVKDIKTYWDSDHPVYGTRDCSIAVFPRSLRQHRDILHHFITKEDMTAFSVVRKAALVGFIPVKTILCGVHTTEEVVGEDSEILLGGGGAFPTHLRRFYRYNIETQKGVCGALVISLSSEMPRKICAIHSGGSYAPGWSGIGSPISQEQLTHMMGLYVEKGEVQVDALVASLPEFNRSATFVRVDLPAEYEGNPKWQDCYEFHLVRGRNFIPLGKVEDPVRVVGATDIRPSVMQGLMPEWPPQQAPAKLRPFWKDGVEIKPMELAMKKADVLPVDIRENILSEATGDVIHLINSFPVQAIDRSVLTYEQALKGVEGDDFIAPMSRRSSPGYPWVHKKESGKPGKETWLGSEENWIVDHPVLKQAVDEREGACLTGQRFRTFWNDVLKDERRPLDRVEAGKTRLFSSGPLDYNVLFRRYFLGFNAHMMRNAIVAESTVGVNPYSRQWDVLAKRLTEVGGNMVAGDFSNFDGTLSPQIMWRVLEVVQAFYKSDVDEYLVRVCLFSELVNSVHLNGDDILGWWQSQPSGNPMTVILNSIYLMIAFRVAFLAIAEEEEPSCASLTVFAKNVRLACNGDDVLVGVSDAVAPWFHGGSIAEFFESIGMTFTSENKDVFFEFRSLCDVTYLKRGFRFDEERGRWVAPLKIDVIMEIPQWCTGKEDEHEVTKENCELCAMELSLHERAVFEHNIAILRRASFVLRRRPIFETYNRYRWLDSNGESMMLLLWQKRN